MAQRPYARAAPERRTAAAGSPLRVRTGLIDKDEMFAFGLHLTDELIDVTLSCTDVAEGDDFGVVFLGDVRNVHLLFMDIQSDVKRAKLVHV